MTTKAELEAVRFILEKEWPDGTTSDSVARAAIKALDDLRKTSQRPLGGPPKVGLTFKPCWSNKTHFVRWIGEVRGKPMAWIVTDDADYGSLTQVTSPIWQWSEPVVIRETARTVKVMDPETGLQKLDDDKQPVTEKVKRAWITEEIAISEIGLVPGEKLHIWNSGNFTVEEVFSRGALLRFQDGSVWADSNHDLKKYYKDGWM